MGLSDRNRRARVYPLTKAGAARSWRETGGDESRRRPGRVLAVVALAVALAGQAPDGGTSRSGLYYQVTGTGRAIVLIHAFSLDHRMWATLTPILAARFRVITYDLAGHGRSPMPGQPFFAHEQLRVLLEDLDVDRAVLVGLSAGAGVAVDFALSYPDRVTRLVLASPSVAGYVPAGSPPGLEAVIEAARAGETMRAAELWAATDMMRAPQSAAEPVRRMIMDNAALWGLRANPQRHLTPPSWSRVEEIRAPTLILWGTADTADVRAVATGLRERIPAARGRGVPNAGHLLTFAPGVTTEIVEFVR